MKIRAQYLAVIALCLGLSAVGQARDRAAATATPTTPAPAAPPHQPPPRPPHPHRCPLHP